MQIIRGVTHVSAAITVVLALLAGDYWTALAFTGLAITTF
jgi:hypothetical protein